MKLALKNLIISEATCQNWKATKTIRPIKSEQKSPDLLTKKITETTDKIQQQ